MESEKFKSLRGEAATADGSSQRILGFLKIDVEYGDVKKLLKLYVVPSLKQDLYLGIDFWELYDLLPSNLKIADILPPEASQQAVMDQHELCEAKLENVINCFPSFRQEGLGKTNLIFHSIDVGTARPAKQRHFPVSPAVEKAMYAEIDRMLLLGVRV